MDLRPVLYVVGILLSILAVSMTVPMLIDLYYGNADWQVFFLCILTTAFFGGALVLTNTPGSNGLSISVRQAFLLTTFSWLSLAGFAALPLWFSGLNLSFTDAFFEAMSGITTTGSTVIINLDAAPPGLLIWRALLQWLGGIGIIVMALSVLPFLKVGGMQLFRTESSENEKVMPRAAQMASNIAYIYLGMTFACFIAYHHAGMGLFDAAAHAMTTIATGGFSTYDASIGAFDNVKVESTAILFMILGSLPFVLYLKAIKGKHRILLNDSQVHWFLSIVFISTVILTAYLLFNYHYSLTDSFRKSAFSVVSLITGTGYVSDDYGLWGGFAVNTLFFLMVVGGCAGSTTCGIKIFRFQVLYAVTRVQIKELLHPHGVFIPHYGKKPIPATVSSSVMGFFFMFALCFVGLALALSLTGLDPLTALSGAATSIANVGPGLGEIGPDSNFSALPVMAKWTLCVGMLLGRLELFTVLILFIPSFWRS